MEHIENIPPKLYFMYPPDFLTKSRRIGNSAMDKPPGAALIVQTEGRTTRSNGFAAIFPSSSTRLITDIYGTLFVK
jgi:hypothetical protein